MLLNKKFITSSFEAYNSLEAPPITYMDGGMKLKGVKVWQIIVLIS